MILIEGPYVLYAELSTPVEAMEMMSYKMMDGWEILSLPFPTNFEMVDDGEETTTAHPRTWSILMHHRAAH